MSSRWPAGIIRQTPVTPAGPAENGAAPGMWRMDEVAYWRQQNLWPIPGIIKDPYFPYVSLLLSTTSLSNANNNMFVDSSGAFNPLLRNGNTTQGSFTPYSTNWSGYFDGSGDYLQTPSNSAFALSGVNFTIEAWVYVTSSSEPYQHVVKTSGASNNLMYIDYSGGSNGVLASQVGGTIASQSGVTLNTWHHLAVVRNGTSVTSYVNGVGGTPQAIDPGSSGSVSLLVAYDGGTSPARYFNGYISNLRVVKGTAVYTSNFTPPTSPLTAISGTSLLTCQSNRLRDTSSNNFTITRNGDVRVTDFSPFAPIYPTLGYNQSNITNWSGYFAGGTDDWVSAPSNTAFDFGTGDFCMEAWVFCRDRSSYRAVMTVIGAVSIVIYGGQTMLVLDRATSTALLSDTGVFPLNQWVHVACSRQSGTMRLFINGELRASATVTTSFSSSGLTYIASWDGFNFRWVGNISNARIVKGSAVYTSAFTPSTSPLTAISGTSLLTCQNAAFADNSTNNFVLTTSGTATTTGNSPFNTTGYWSNYFDGSGDYLTIPTNAAFGYGTGDFTIEFWLNLSGVPAAMTVVSNLSSASGTSPHLYISTDGTLRYYTASADRITSSAVTLQQWVHVALCRSSGSTRLFFNGVQTGSTYSDSNNYGSSNPVGIATYWNGTPVTTNTLFGYLSNLRILNGVGLYTTTFTPPTSPLTAVSGTSLLTCQNGRFIDNSTNNLTLTAAGNTAAESFDPFYTSTIASNGGSMYFDGSGDYLSLPDNGALQLGSSSFTVEYWWYPITISGYQTPFEKGYTGSGGLLLQTGNGDGKIIVYASGSAVITASTAVGVGGWNHMALVRNGTSLVLYLNGVSVGSVTNSTDFNSAGVVGIGANVSGGGAGAYPINGFMSDVRVTKGTAVYTANFTPPTAPVTPTSATTLLANGMNAGIFDQTTINDLETVGNAQVSTVQSKFGGSSVYFDGTGDRIFAPPSDVLNLANGDFTVEAWVYSNTIAAGNAAAATRSSSGNIATGSDLQWSIYRSGSSLFVRAYQSTTDFSINVGTIAANTWYHVAITRSGTTVRGFLNGVLAGTTRTITGALNNNTTWYGAIMGGITVSSVNEYWNGYIDELRITKGYARYTATFTPPTQAFPTF